MSVKTSTVNLTAKPYCIKREEFSVAEAIQRSYEMLFSQGEREWGSTG